MNRAFLFDMDGVLVDSESVWEDVERDYLPKIFGPEIAANMGSLVGLGITDVIARAKSLGAPDEICATYSGTADEMAKLVYSRSAITRGVDVLVDVLIASGFRIAVVTQSPLEWIERVIPRLSFKDKIETVVSLHEHPELKRKPAPDGFLYACRIFGAKPSDSVVLEDSNRGIESGKAAGCYVIGFRGNLVPGYVQQGADAYADTMEEVSTIAEAFKRT